MQVNILVTQDHIDRGTQCNSSDCAITQALLDAGFAGVAVDYNDIFVTDEHGAEFVCHTPQDVHSFLWDFDQSKDFCEPTEFELEFEPYVEESEW